jgi:predicted phosphodiesterase
MIRDLGQLSGEILLYGGPYSNLAATNALFDWADRAEIPRQQRICTGDIVAYCAHPNETTDLMRQRGGPVIAGNCEKQLAANADDCGCGFEDGTACSLLARDWYSFANRHLRADHRAFMAGLPDWITFTYDSKRFAVIHGGARDISRFLWAVSSPEAFEQEIRYLEREIGPIDAVISGHSGIAFQRQIGQVNWINAGVIGMPAHDGQTRTTFATLTASGVQFHPLTYDYKAEAQAMRAAGLDQGYERALECGLWPSEDVLPPSLRVA